MAKTLLDSDIRVNGVAPGIIRTKFAASLLTNEEAIKDKLNVDRIGEPQDIANAAAFLCSDEASYVNGETMLVTRFVAPRL